MDNIKISVSESGPNQNISIIRVDGVVDTLTATELEEVLDRILKRNRFNLIFDLAGVDYISSAGWGIFISRVKEIRENNGDIKLANMIPNVYEIYELLEFDNILPAFENVGMAKAAFGNPSGASPAKKKDPAVDVRTTVEELPSIQSAFHGKRSESERVLSATGSNSRAEELILKAIKDDPFYTILELKLVLEESISDGKLGWWDIFLILKRNRLVSRRARFRYARKLWKRS